MTKRKPEAASSIIDRINGLIGPSAIPDGPQQQRPGDLRDGSVYHLADDLAFAVNVAVVTGRPLLLSGAPGSGKSSLAPYLASALGWRYYEQVITSRTEATDLLWRFDTVRKLSDATAPKAVNVELNDADYVEPGVLWWAVDPDSARTRGRSNRPANELGDDINAGRSATAAVVLIDEIDKADPDVPNALLVALGSFEFVVQETGHRVKMRAADVEQLLIIITSNGERDLPAAFIRRCVCYTLPAPDQRRLVAIARLHAEVAGRKLTKKFGEHLERLAKRTVDERDAVALSRRAPGTAEFLDAVIAALELELPDNDPRWEKLINLAIVKGEMRR